MYDLELIKEFDKFKEVTDLTIALEYALEMFSVDMTYPQLAIGKFRMVCLRYKLCEIEELENLREFNEKQLLDLCKNIKKSIREFFFEKIKRKKRREFIQAKIKEERKERYKKQQREKNGY